MARVYGTSQESPDQKAARAQAAALAAAKFAEQQREFQQREADRTEAAKFREQSGRQAAARNLIGMQSLRQSRKEGSAARSEQQKDREAAALEQLTNSGMLAPNWEKTASPLAQAARNRILENMHLNPANVPEDPKLAAMRAEVAKSGQAAPGQVPAAQVPTTATPLPQTPTQGPAASGDDAMDRAMMQAVQSLSGGGQQDVRTPAQQATEEAAGRAVQRREALAGAGPVHFDPNMQANVRSSAGGDFVVGAPDPSVGAARGSQYAETPGGGTAFLTPDRGYVELGAPRNAQAAQYRQAWMQRNAMTPFKPSALATGGDWTTGTGHIGTAPAAPEKPLSETALPNVLPATTGTNAGGAGRGVGLVNQPAPPGTPEQAPPGSVFNASTPVGGPVRGFFRNIGIRFPPEVPWDPNDVGKQNAWNVPPYRRGPNAGVPQVPESQPQFAPSNLATPPTAGTGPFGHPIPPAPQQQPVAQNAASPLSPEQRPPPLNQQQPIQPIRPPVFF